MFGIGRTQLSHPNFHIVTSEKAVTVLVNELRSKPEQFFHLSRTKASEDPRGPQDPVVSIKAKSWGIELLVAWGVRTHSVFEVRLPIDEKISKVFPVLGEIPGYSDRGFMLTFSRRAVGEKNSDTVLFIKISSLPRKSSPVHLESFALQYSKDQNWRIQPFEHGAPVQSVVMQETPIFDGVAKLPPVPPESSPDDDATLDLDSLFETPPPKKKMVG